MYNFEDYFQEDAPYQWPFYCENCGKGYDEIRSECIDCDSFLTDAETYKAMYWGKIEERQSALRRDE